MFFFISRFLLSNIINHLDMSANPLKLTLEQDHEYLIIHLMLIQL